MMGARRLFRSDECYDEAVHDECSQVFVSSDRLEL